MLSKGRSDPGSYRAFAASLLALLLAAVPQAGQRLSRSARVHHEEIVRASSMEAARAAVLRAGGVVTHDLAIIDSVAAELTSEQRALLATDPHLTMALDRLLTVSGSTGTVQPYVVEHTGANRLHASGITGRGITIAFLDSGWWSQHATQTDTAGQNVVLQGYDAIGNTVGVGAPDDHYGHGTHILSIATNSGRSGDGSYIGIAPDASRVIIRAFDQT